MTMLSQMLSIAVNGPEEVESTTEGLLGAWNNNVNDDLKDLMEQIYTLIQLNRRCTIILAIYG